MNGVRRAFGKSGAFGERNRDKMTVFSWTEENDGCYPADPSVITIEMMYMLIVP